MSLEVFGTSGDDIDVSAMERHWESNPEGTVWWRIGEPETTYTFQEAAEAYESWAREID